MDGDNNGIFGSSRQTLKQKRKSRRSMPGSKRALVSQERYDMKTVNQRVFIYMQLKNIWSPPVVSYPLELHLYHLANTLQKMTEHYTKETVIYEHELNSDRPAFALSVMQDSLEDLILFGDNPLIVTLYQRIPRHRKGELITVAKIVDPMIYEEKQGHKSIMAVDKSSTGTEVLSVDPAKASLTDDRTTDAAEEDGEEEEIEYVEESLEFVSRGHCDLLQLFQSKRFISNISIMLYPEYLLNLETSTVQKITATTDWSMYSILPVLKSLHFTNMLFITLESIYNAPDWVHLRCDRLGIKVSIRATTPDEDDIIEEHTVCSFHSFTSQIIKEQQIMVVWENIKRQLLAQRAEGIANTQMDTTLHVPIQRLFSMLLKTEGVDFQLEHIDPMLDSALINNSLHRFILTSEMEEIIELAVVHHDYELFLQLYDIDPDNVLYEGSINMSVLGYPNVNGCRFAAELYPVARRSTGRTTRKSEFDGTVRQTTRRTTRMTEFEATVPMFAIVNLCLFNPITEHTESLHTYNESIVKAGRLRHCFPMASFTNLSRPDILREIYRNFDELIRDLISYIIKKDVVSVEERPNFFCCTLANLRNVLLNICGNDFNVRTPTKNNVEFREMLTLMHSELMERIRRVLSDCGWEDIANCILHSDSNQIRMRRLLDEYRRLCLIGDCVLAKQLFGEIKADCENKMLFNFYVFLNSVEMLNFENARYYLLHQKESNWKGEYFVNLLELYINYQVHLQSEEDPGEAFSSMMDNLRLFSRSHSLDSEGWILLYCFYNQKNYLPGMEFTRWKYENLFEVPCKIQPTRPRPLFNIFLPERFDVLLKSKTVKRFYEVFILFAELGAYGFAQVVYDHIAVNFTPVESYLVETTLKMLQGQIDDGFKMQKLPVGKDEQGVRMKLYQAHINGNVEFSRRHFPDAIKEFKVLLEISPLEPETLDVFNISLLRLGRLCFEAGDYECALQAYKLCLPYDSAKKDFVSNYFTGVSLYYMGQLEEARDYLARSTKSDVYTPDPWGFLAIINLRLHKNMTALNCWKIAKMYPEIRMNNRIYTELENINYSDVCLLVEDDCKPP